MADLPAQAQGHVLLIDDDPSLLRLLTLRLQAAGLEVSSAASAAEGLALLRQRSPEAVITDLRMHGMDGCALQREIARQWPGLPVIIITAHGTIPDAVEATRCGAFAFLTKPLDPAELLSTVEQARASCCVVQASGAWREGMLGDSEPMRRLLDRVRRVARGQSNVLITGPSGSGKDVLARAVHRASGRVGEFVAVNCAAIPASLLESELFGHRKGAFTGASEHNPGLMRRADGGTLLLDEVGDMPLELQAKLLRVIEDRAVRPVGGQESVRVDLRIVAATHQDLERARARGQFRDDLYYRLRVVELCMPTLCERAADIPILAQHKLTQLALEMGSPVSRFSPTAMTLLMAAPWPGQVRQLFNLIEQCVMLSPSPVIGEAAVREALAEWRMGAESARVQVPSLSDARDRFMHDYLCRVLGMAHGNVSEAARLARRNRTDFYKLLQRHHVDRERFKSD